MSAYEARWQRLRPLLEQALTLPEKERAAFVSGLGHEAADLRDELEKLIAAAHTGADPVARVLVPEVLAELADNADAAEARVGQALGAYRLVRVLGRGGMGTVYLAERSGGGFGQHVALKVVEGSALGGAARARFERERQILATLRHPAIASLFDGGETRDGLPYYTMELVEGTSIDEHCRTHVPSVRGRVELVLEVAAALAYAHRRLIVHRDIKPGNVLVTTEGSVKLLDFGIAKPLGENEAHVTQAALGPMTREYAAPEQFRGGEITVATDVYQLGTLCYRLLTGNLPYRADPGDTYAWSRALSEDDPLTPERALGDGTAAGWSEHMLARVRRQLRGDLAAILGKALAKSPTARYESMEAFAADLRAHLTGRPVGARSAGAVYYAWRFLARRPYVSIGSALALAALVATTLVAVRQAAVAQQQVQRANNISEFLKGLFKVSDPGVNRGEKLTANQILERGAERIDKDFADQPEQKAQLLVVIGDVYSNLGDYARCIPPLERAVETLRTTHSTDAILQSRALGFVAWCYFRQGDHNKALGLYDEAEELVKDSTSQEGRLLLAATHAQRGGALQGQGDSARAETEVAKSLAILESAGAGDSRAAGASHNSFALLLRDKADYLGARRELEKAIAIYRHIDDDVRVAGASQNLAGILIELRELDQARRTMEKALAQLLKIYGPNSEVYASGLDTMGRIALAQRQYDEAIGLFATSEQIYAAALGAHNARRAYPRHNSGQVELARGNPTAALAHFDAALALRRELLPNDHPEIANTLDARGETLLTLGRSAEARDDAERALAIRRLKLAADHPDVVRSLVHVGLIRSALADCAGARSAWDEARERAPRAFSKDPESLAKIRGTLDAAACRQDQ